MDGKKKVSLIVDQLNLLQGHARGNVLKAFEKCLKCIKNGHKKMVQVQDGSPNSVV